MKWSSDMRTSTHQNSFLWFQVCIPFQNFWLACVAKFFRLNYKYLRSLNVFSCFPLKVSRGTFCSLWSLDTSSTCCGQCRPPVGSMVFFHSGGPSVKDRHKRGRPWGDRIWLLTSRHNSSRKSSCRKANRHTLSGNKPCLFRTLSPTTISICACTNCQSFSSSAVVLAYRLTVTFSCRIRTNHLQPNLWKPTLSSKFCRRSPYSLRIISQGPQTVHVWLC